MLWIGRAENILLINWLNGGVLDWHIVESSWNLRRDRFTRSKWLFGIGLSVFLLTCTRLLRYGTLSIL